VNQTEVGEVEPPANRPPIRLAIRRCESTNHMLTWADIGRLRPTHPGIVVDLRDHG
jgi:hypothetical protein